MNNAGTHSASHPLPEALGYCAVIDGFLTPQECRHYIARAVTSGFQTASNNYPRSYRNNDRVVIDDEELAASLFKKIQAEASSVVEAPSRSQSGHWRPVGINSKIRFCRYTAGQQFNIHQDGVHFRSHTCRSMLTFMVYLNDPAEFSGGDTVFFSAGPGSARTEQAPPIVARVQPKQGSLIIFDHSIWHAGDTVLSGTKYILRSDVLYRNDNHSTDPSHTSDESEHRGYVWTMTGLSADQFASGGRDCSIRIWNGMRKPIATLKGHTQSVLGVTRLDDEKLASVSRDHSLRIWNTHTRECIVTAIAHDAAVLTVTKLDSVRLATGGADHRINIWSHDAQPLATISAHSDWVWKIIRVSDQLFASASEDGSVRLWHMDSLKLVTTLPGSKPLRTIAIAPNGKRLVTGDATGCLRIWTDLITKPRIVAELDAHSASIRCVRFLDEHTLATGGEDFRLRVWSGWPLKPVYEWQHDNFVTDVITLDQSRCASCSYDGTITLHTWNTSP